MHSDVFFTGCHNHPTCEDYGRAGKVDDHSYVIVSDGCSSSPDTDFGARFLTLAAVQSLPNPSAKAILYGANDFVCTPLTGLCLDATLLVAHEGFVPSGVHVEVAGDGIVIARLRQPVGLHVMFEFDFQNAPGYLSYLDNPERLQNYKDQGCGQRTVRAYRIAAGEERRLVGVGTEDAFTDGSDPPFYSRFFPAEAYDLVLICSDGILSFQEKETLQSVPVERVIDHLVRFKSYAGAFVQRRMRRFLTKECAELGWQHNDDVSVGAIYTGD